MIWYNLLNQENGGYRSLVLDSEYRVKDFHISPKDGTHFQHFEVGDFRVSVVWGPAEVSYDIYRLSADHKNQFENVSCAVWNKLYRAINRQGYHDFLTVPMPGSPELKLVPQPDRTTR